MAIVLPGILVKILHIFSFAALVIVGSTYSYYLSQYKYSWKIRTGCEVKNSCNALFFYNFAAIGFAIISFLYAVVELLMLFGIKQIQAVDAGFVKPVVYIVDEICVLGLCGDLGIAAGVLCMAAGVIWLLVALFASI